jgi:adenosine deaminase
MRTNTNTQAIFDQERNDNPGFRSDSANFAERVRVNQRKLAADPSMAAFIQALPKTETHLHIEGALPLDLLQRVVPKKFYRSAPPWWADDYRYEDFGTFEKVLLDHASLWFTSPARYHEAARVIFASLAQQNVRYVEISFHLRFTQFIGAEGEEIIDAIRQATPHGMVVHVFAGMLRSDYTPTLMRTIDQLATWQQLSGVDLHGVETVPLQPWTKSVWERVRYAGKETKAHAGEFGGADNVREAVEVLGVRRVQHGVRAVEDPAVVALLKERGVTCDVCPISNVKLKVAPSMKLHPLRRLFDAGVRCTISTDDPFSFGNTLNEEYAALARNAGFSREELWQLARNGFEVATMDETVRRAHLDDLERVGTTYL